MSAVEPTLVLTAPGARVWRADGLAATVTRIGPDGVYAKVDGERVPVILPLPGWRLAFPCDYCDQAATVQLRDGQPGDVLCRACATGQFDRPADWVRPIPHTVIRALYEQCVRLG